MSRATRSDDEEDGAGNFERSPEEKLRALVRRDPNPRITAMAKEALRRRQEGSS